MINKNELSKCVGNLLKSANDRKTKQGVKIYEGALNKIALASSQDELSLLTKKLNHALVGIESHGELTPKEFEIVKIIRSMS
jgi:hypothetical protein